jgi:hypothetical protein
VKDQIAALFAMVFAEEVFIKNVFKKLMKVGST